MALLLPSAHPRSATSVSALAALRRNHYESLQDATPQDFALSAAAASFALRNSAHAPYFALLRRECRAWLDRPEPQGPPPTPSSPGPLVLPGQQPLRYVHDPYSPKGTTWLPSSEQPH
eukprot:EG_transcript_10500